mgnify:CR=1 FL=1
MLTQFMPQTTFKNKDIVDITKSVKVSDLVYNDIVSLQDYTVPDGDRPSDVAYDYYDDPSLAWLVLLPNREIDPYFNWPLNQQDFDRWMEKKRGSVETAKATIIWYEHRTKNLTISVDTYNHVGSLSHITGGDYQAVYEYDYYERINENNRHIQLVNKDYLPIIFAELKKIFKRDV